MDNEDTAKEDMALLASAILAAASATVFWSAPVVAVLVLARQYKNWRNRKREKETPRLKIVRQL